MAFKVVNSNLVWTMVFIIGMVVVAIAFGQIFSLGSWSDLIGRGGVGGAGDTLAAVGKDIIGG